MSILSVFFFFSLVHLSITTAPKLFNCSSYDAKERFSTGLPGSNCLSLLQKNGQAFHVCKERVCFLFLEQEPFISFDEEILSYPNTEDLQKPFRCDRESRRHHHPSLHGGVFNLMDETSAKDQYCAWAGPLSQCTFNALVDFIKVMAEEGYQFGIINVMLETEKRLCHHTPSTTLVQSPLLLIGRKDSNHASKKETFFQLTKPFKLETWSILGIITILFAVVAVGIASRLHRFHGRSMSIALFILFGDSDEALAEEIRPQEDERFSTTNMNSNVQNSMTQIPTQYPTITTQERRWIRTKYRVAINFFRVGLLSFMAIFALFYELALVNFLFQNQSPSFRKRIRDMERSELQNIAVLKDSGEEEVLISIGLFRSLQVLFNVYCSLLTLF